jgi:hypothetical protein
MNAFRKRHRFIDERIEIQLVIVIPPNTKPIGMGSALPRCC